MKAKDIKNTENSETKAKKRSNTIKPLIGIAACLLLLFLYFFTRYSNGKSLDVYEEGFPSTWIDIIWLSAIGVLFLIFAVVHGIRLDKNAPDKFSTIYVDCIGAFWSFIAVLYCGISAKTEALNVTWIIWLIAVVLQIAASIFVRRIQRKKEEV